MGILVLFSEPDHLAQLSNMGRLFRLPNSFSFTTTSDFYNSAKFSNVLTHDWYVCTYTIEMIQCNYTEPYNFQNTIILHYVWYKNRK